MLMYKKILMLGIWNFLFISSVNAENTVDWVESEWPSGSYAVPMTIDGCPEDADRGWKTSTLKITTKYPMNRMESYRDCFADDNSSKVLANFTTGGFRQIAGIHDAYTLQLYFCYKTTEHQADSNASWPVGNYSIYGVKDGCPHDFGVHNVSICLPQLLAVDRVGYLPFASLTENSQSTTLQLSVCTHTTKNVSTSESYRPQTHPFSFLRIPGQECPSIVGHRKSTEMLPLFVPILNVGEYAGEQIEFCYFMPDSYRFGVLIDYTTEDKEQLRYIFRDCRGFLYVTPRLGEYSCSGQITGFLTDYCDRAVKLTIDAGKVVRTSGVMLKLNRLDSFYEFRTVFANNTRVFTDNGRVCRHNVSAWNSSEINQNVVFTCVRTLEARHFMLIVEVEHDPEYLKKIMAHSFVTLVSCVSDTADKNVSTCQSELGMRDLGIQDFQISASSSQHSHEPKQARPQYNGWCAALYDKKPYVQVDLVSVTTVEGIVIYNWVEIDEYTFENVYTVDVHIRGCHSFHIEHGISRDAFMLLSKEPFIIDKSVGFEEPHSTLFFEPLLARYIRVYPYGHDNRSPACLKLELLGCRKPGTLSLNCHQSQHREIFETDQLFIQSSEKSETRLNMSNNDCQDWCLYNRTECIGIELSNNTCKMFMSDGTQSYKRFQSNSTAAMAPCWQERALPESVFFHLFEDSVINAHDLQVIFNNITVLTSVGYPFSYDDNQIYRWNIYSATGKHLTLQFTDISLKTNNQFDNSHMFLNEELCEDTIIVTSTETHRLVHRMDDHIYIFDNKYNGKYPNVPLLYSNIFLEFRTCTRRQHNYQIHRGFSVYIFEEDETYPCLQKNNICSESSMELQSGSFLGHLLEQDTVYVWLIALPHTVLFELLDFDVSCSSGTKFSLSEIETGLEKTYCNGNRTYTGFLADVLYLEVSYFTPLQACGQVLFQEGFHLTYGIPERNDAILNLTTFQTEIVDSLPVMITSNSFPLRKVDRTHYMLNEGRIKKVCSGMFNKCYSLYIGMPEMAWIDAMTMCVQRNKTLVNFRTKLEMEYVRHAVLAWVDDIGDIAGITEYLNLPLTIGLNRYIINEHKHQDYWSDGSLVEFTAWDTNEPQGANLRRCTSMSLTDQGGWSTKRCEDYSRGNIVCEAAMDTSIITKQELVTPLVAYIQPNASALMQVQHLLKKCNNGEWVSMLAVCNGVDECTDGSDEQGCLPEGMCEEDEFLCDGGRCIHISRVCDQIEDCNDMSDESCEYETCPSYTFTCDGGICHRFVERCDGMINCKDGTDETDCEICRGAIRCDVIRTCIPRTYACDGSVDCIDFSDEANCPTTIKTCEDLLDGGVSESGLKVLNGKYIRCDFEEDEMGRPINHTMTYYNVDWLHLKDAEYRLEPYEFIHNAISSRYTCSQKFTQELRRPATAFKELMKWTVKEARELVMQYNLSETYSALFMQKCTFKGACIYNSSATTDSFEVHLYPELLQLRYFDNFDVEKNRIAIGPIECTKDSKSNRGRPISCGSGIRPVDEHLRCLYSVDSNYHLNGCITLNHLQDCAEFVCPEGYVKCPGSYCVHSHKVCDGNMDCVYGEDEQNCWCEDDEKTILIFVDFLAATQYHKIAYNLAGKMYSDNRTVMVVKHRMMFGYIRGQVIKSNTGHELVYSQDDYILEFRMHFKWEEWPLEDFYGIHKILTSSKRHMLVWISQSSTKSEMDEAVLNYITKYINTYGGVTRLYNVHEDRTLKTNTKMVSSAVSVTEILVRDWEILEAAGPLLFTEDCTRFPNTSCSQGYRCLQSRVCLSLNQVCDSIKQCPKGDDEKHCEFKCPLMCDCSLLTMKCSEEDDSGLFPVMDIHSSTRSIDLSTTKTFGNVFLIMIQFEVIQLRYLLALNISECQIEELNSTQFSGLKSLRSLDISNNRLTVLSSSVLSKLTHLTSLYLHGNSLLTYIEPGAFSNLKINFLDLTGCSISTLSSNTFDGLILAELDISFNKIEQIEDNTFNGLSVKYLKLQGNRISLFSKQMFNGLTDVENIHTPASKFCCIRPSYLKDESCLPYKDEFSSCADLMRNQTLQGLLWTIGSLALIGNVLSLLYRINFDKKRLKISYGIFVTNLAISDLLMGIYLFIIAIADRLFRDRYIEVDDYWRNSYWCRLAGVLSTVSSEASVLFIAFITIDRILVIKFPFGNVRFSVRMAVVVSAVCWVSVLFLSILPLIYVEYFSDSFYSKSAVCLALPLTRDRPPGWLYSISIFIGFNFVMFVLIAIGQLLIYLEIKKQTSETKRMNVARRNDLKVARNLLLLVSTDFLCWFPIGCIGLMAINGYVIPGEVYAWTAVLVLPINSALNPFLYTFSAIISAKSFKPSLDEQTHQDSSKETGKTFVRLHSLLSQRRSKSGQTTSLSDRIAQKPLRVDELVLITATIVRAVSYLHDESLIMKTLDKENVMIQTSSNGNKIRHVYPNQQPYVSSRKTDKAEDVFSLGCLIGDCIESSRHHD